jgi:hypothetical protein
MIELTMSEMETIHGGEVISLTAIMAIMIIAITTVIVYRLFMSNNGVATIPGGFRFEWK